METLPNIAMGDNPSSDYYVENVFYPDRPKCRFCRYFKDGWHIVTLRDDTELDFDGYCNYHKDLRLDVNRGDYCGCFTRKTVQVVKPRNLNNKVGVNVEIKQN